MGVAWRGTPPSCGATGLGGPRSLLLARLDKERLLLRNLEGWGSSRPSGLSVTRAWPLPGEHAISSGPRAHWTLGGTEEERSPETAPG